MNLIEIYVEKTGELLLQLKDGDIPMIGAHVKHSSKEYLTVKVVRDYDNTITEEGYTSVKSIVYVKEV